MKDYENKKYQNKKASHPASFEKLFEKRTIFLFKGKTFEEMEVKNAND